MKNNYLMHHGIKGMRWGVRRYQNKDGSLTSAGRNRYGDGRAENGGHFSPTRNRGSKTSKGGRLTARDRREIAELDEIERAERRSDNQPANFRPASRATVNYMKGLEKEARKGGRLTARDKREMAELDEVERAERRSDNQPANFRPASKATIKYMKGLEKEARKADKQNRKRELTPEEKQARKEKLIKGAKTAAAILGTAAVVGGAVYAANKYSKYTAKTRADAENRLRELANREAERQRRSMPNHTSGTFTGSHANATDNSPYSFPLMNRTTSAMNRRVSSGHANDSKAWTGEFADSYRAQSASVRAARNNNSKSRSARAPRETDAERRLRELANRKAEEMKMRDSSPRRTSDRTSGTFTGSHANTAVTNQYNIPRMNRTTSAHNRRYTSGHANDSKAWTGEFADSYRAQSASVRAARNIQSRREANARRNSNNSDHTSGPFTGSFTGSRADARRSMKYGSAVTPRMNRGVTAMRSNDSVQRANARAAANTERARAALEEHMRRTGSRRR